MYFKCRNGAFQIRQQTGQTEPGAQMTWSWNKSLCVSSN